MPNQLEHYSCVDCGDHIYVDEDGLCVSCGGKTTIEKCGDCSRSYVAIRKERDELRDKLLRLHAEQQSEVEELRAEVARLKLALQKIADTKMGYQDQCWDYAHEALGTDWRATAKGE